jgi:hypothetical protein
VLHALPQTQTNENADQNGNKQDRDGSSPPALEKLHLGQCGQLYR